MNVPCSEPESLIKAKAYIVFGGNTGKKRSQMQSAKKRVLFHIQMVLLRSEEGCGHLILLGFSLSLLCDVCNPIC